MTRPPLASLKVSIFLLLAALLLSAAGILWSKRQHAQAEAALQARHAVLNAARAQQQRSRTEARLIDQHLEAFRTLAAQGFVGEESRLAWIEAVQLANRDSGLYGLSYTLSPRTTAPATLSGGLPLNQTRMVVKMPLLVETDLPRFVDALKARAPGVFRVDRCRLGRAGNAPPEPINEPELDAECELLWFTVAAEERRAP